MLGLRIQLLGHPAVYGRDGAGAEVPVSVQPLLALLAIEESGQCHRERITDRLWPDLDQDHARRRVNTAVWRLRHLLGDDSHELVKTTAAGFVELDVTKVEVDATQLWQVLTNEHLAAAGRGDEAAMTRIVSAVTDHAGVLLAGCYHDWVIRARERLSARVLRGIETVVDALPDDLSPRSLELTELLVQRDPLREDAQRRLMRLYASAGRRGDALRQYETLERALHTELGVEPLPETTLAAAAIREGVVPLRGDEPDSAGALIDLRDALAACRQAVESIERVLESMPAD